MQKFLGASNGYCESISLISILGYGRESSLGCNFRRNAGSTFS